MSYTTKKGEEDNTDEKIEVVVGVLGGNGCSGKAVEATEKWCEKSLSEGKEEPSIKEKKGDDGSGAWAVEIVAGKFGGAGNANMTYIILGFCGLKGGVWANRQSTEASKKEDGVTGLILKSDADVMNDIIKKTLMVDPNFLSPIQYFFTPIFKL